MEQFAQLYDELIDTTLLSSQCHTAKAFLELEMKEDVEEEKNIMLALTRLKTMSVAFSEVIKLFKIAATICMQSPLHPTKDSFPF